MDFLKEVGTTEVARDSLKIENLQMKKQTHLQLGEHEIE